MTPYFQEFKYSLNCFNDIFNTLVPSKILILFYPFYYIITDIVYNHYNDLGKKASSSHTHSFASITNKPTNLTGYGIADATKALLAEKFEYGHAITFISYTSNPINIKPKSDTDSVIGAPYKKGWTRVICNMYTNSEHAFITYMDMSSNPDRITITITNTSNSSVQIEIGRASCRERV